MRPSLFACIALLSAGCMMPPGPAERLSFAAHDLNTATRFARMDVALSYVKQDVRLDFAQRHRKWHRQLRIVDVDLTGMHMVRSGEAEVQLSVSWHRLDETIMRSSSVAQKWKLGSKDWLLVEERRVGGSPGLFAKVRDPKRDEPSGEQPDDAQPSGEEPADVRRRAS